MFEYMNGQLDLVCPEYITVEVGGIGYLIMTPNPFAFSEQIGKQIKIYVYHLVREDFQGLYGFATRLERNFFIKLINVTGIGPKGALAVLASGEVAHVVRAIELEDESYLIKFPGVGKKTARQIILDLKGKLKNFTEEIPIDVASPVLIKTTIDNAQLEEARLALQALGYSEKELTKISAELAKELCTTEQYIRKALQLLMR